MGKYYCLIAGLPDITLDDSKLTYSVADFREELDGILTDADKKLIDLFYLKFDNKNVLAYIKQSESNPESRGRIAYDELDALYKALREEEKPPKNNRIPAYFERFFQLYIENEENENKRQDISWEDRLAALYYAYAMKNSNKFVVAWFELNLNINNMLTAITCRKHGLDKAEYIVSKLFFIASK
jgi:hypothetical protein